MTRATKCINNTWNVQNFRDTIQTGNTGETTRLNATSCKVTATYKHGLE